MKKVALLFCLIVVMALSSIGFGFAKWSSALGATVNTKTGSPKLAWVNNSMIQKDWGPDWHASQGLKGFILDPEKKDVGSTSGSFADTDNDTFLDRFNVTVDNAYPFYFNEISGNITNEGTIPLIIQAPVLHWMGTDKVIDDGYVYWLGKDGHIIMPNAQQIAKPLEVDDNWVLEIRWMDNIGKQIEPGQVLEESFDLQVLESAAQKTKYTVGISVEAIQWNEIR